MVNQHEFSTLVPPSFGSRTFDWTVSTTVEQCVAFSPINPYSPDKHVRLIPETWACLNVRFDLVDVMQVKCAKVVGSKSSKEVGLKSNTSVDWVTKCVKTAWLRSGMIFFGP